MAFLGRLLPALGGTPEAGALLAVLDGQGRVLHQAGHGTAASAGPAVVSLSLAPDLPHWQVAGFWPSGEPSGGGRGFFILALLMVGIFLVAILAGGALITRQAFREARDARQKTSFVANVSHELKTPLTTIRMYAELLASGRVEPVEKQNHYLSVIVEESRRLTRLVNNVLDFGRLEQGRKRYRLEPLELGPWIEAFLKTHQVRLAAAGMSARFGRPQGDATVRVDRDALEQVLLNLLDNAVKYAASGRRFDVGLDPSGEGWALSVEDRGPGIPANCREKVFETFSRLDDSLTARQPGSGLGLTIARRLMRGMGGDLTVDTPAAGGARFVVRLPAVLNPEAEM
jgi:signal transduction histidine kinase